MEEVIQPKEYDYTLENTGHSGVAHLLTRKEKNRI